MDATYIVPAVFVVSRETGEITDIRTEEITAREARAFWSDLERIAQQQTEIEEAIS